MAKTKTKCVYTVEPGRNIYMNGQPYISIGREGETIPAHVDRLTHQIAAFLNKKGCFVTEFYPERRDRWERSGGASGVSSARKKGPAQLEREIAASLSRKR